MEHGPRHPTPVRYKLVFSTFPTRVSMLCLILGSPKASPDSRLTQNMTYLYSAGVASEALFLFFKLVISEYEANMEYSYPGFGFPSPLEGEFQEGWLFFFLFLFLFLLLWSQSFRRECDTWEASPKTARRPSPKMNFSLIPSCS